MHLPAALTPLGTTTLAASRARLLHERNLPPGGAASMSMACLGERHLRTTRQRAALAVVMFVVVAEGMLGVTVVAVVDVEDVVAIRTLKIMDGRRRLRLSLCALRLLGRPQQWERTTGAHRHRPLTLGKDLVLHRQTFIRNILILALAMY